MPNIKIDHNYDEVAKRVLKLRKKFKREVGDALRDTMEIAVNRIRERNILDGVGRKRGRILLEVPGADLTRKNSKDGKKFFSSKKIVARSPKTWAAFKSFKWADKDENFDNVKYETTTDGKDITVSVEYVGDVGRAIMLSELRNNRLGKKKKPITKGINYARKRFYQVLGKIVESENI